MEELLRHLSWLSRLQLNEDEEEMLAARLHSARSLIDRLLEADVAADPLYHPLEKEGLLRADEPRGSLPRDLALVNAAKVEKGYVVAPRTVEE